VLETPLRFDRSIEMSRMRRQSHVTCESSRSRG